MPNLGFIVAIAVCLIGFDSTAYAYLDPGTGSMILQLLLGGVAGSLVVIKLYWLKIKGFFSSQPPKETEQRE